MVKCKDLLCHDGTRIFFSLSSLFALYPFDALEEIEVPCDVAKKEQFRLMLNVTFWLKKTRQGKARLGDEACSICFRVSGVPLIRSCSSFLISDLSLDRRLAVDWGPLPVVRGALRRLHFRVVGEVEEEIGT